MKTSENVITVKSVELGKSVAVVNRNNKYNELIDNMANAILALKANPAEDGFIDLKTLWDIHENFSVLTSAANRKKIEKAFQNMYDQLTYENSVMVDLMKSGNVPEEVEIFTV